jgi:hypothetical protein
MNKHQKLVQQQFLNDEEKVIKRLRQVYDQSLKDITGKISNLDTSISTLQKVYNSVGTDEIGDLAAAFFKGKTNITPDEAKETLQSMIQSKVYQKKYQEALKKQVGGILDTMHDKEFKAVSEYLDECYENGFVGTMFDLQGQGIPMCFPLDQEQMVRAVQLDSKISKGLYTRLGEDVALLKKKITAQVSRGISTGMSFQQVAEQLAGTSNIGYNNAVRIARTEGHRIQCQAGMDACYTAKDKGAEVVKQWDSTLDSSTRESHVAVDGEIRELDEKFSNGLMFPSDPAGGAAEVINCRCALLQRARWALEGSFTKMNNFTKQIEEFESIEDYEEFKKAFFSKENRQFMNYHETLEERYETKDFGKLLGNMTDREYNHYTKLMENSPLYNSKNSRKVLTNAGKSDKIKSPDIQIGKSIGAKAKNYDIELPNKEIVHLTEGSKITNIETIAGKGRNRQIDEIDLLLERYGGTASEWQKKKGLGYVDYDGESYHAELHWYEEPTVGRHKWKVKPDADGNWFIEDDQ